MVVVKLFAQVRERAGRSEIQLDLPADAVVSDVAPALAASVPAIAELLGVSRIAVNRAFAAPDAPVRPGDELAVIPPVSGG